MADRCDLSVEDKMDTGPWVPMYRPNFDHIRASGCWLCPCNNHEPVNLAFLCVKHTDELRAR